MRCSTVGFQFTGLDSNDIIWGQQTSGKLGFLENREVFHLVWKPLRNEVLVLRTTEKLRDLKRGALS